MTSEPTTGVVEVAIEATSSTFEENDPSWRRQVAALRTSLQQANIGDLRQEARFTSGHKGTLETLIIALGSSGAITAAVELFKVWTQRDRNRCLHLTIKNGEQTTKFELDGTSANDDTMQSVMVAALQRVSS